MINETELEQDSAETDDILIEQENKSSFKLETINQENIDDKKISPVKSHIKFSGDLQRDLIQVMSQKPDQFYFSFTGLKRYLGVHQQQLVNTLDRLLEDSILHKTAEGYLLSPEFRKNNIKNEIYYENWNESEIWIGKRIYPATIPIQKLYKELYGKWFGKHRFLGGIHNPDFIILDWVDMDNSNAKTRLKANSISVELKFKSVSVFERDKALNVFSETFISLNNPIIFENSSSYLNN